MYTLCACMCPMNICAFYIYMSIWLTFSWGRFGTNFLTCIPTAPPISRQQVNNAATLPNTDKKQIAGFSTALVEPLMRRHPYIGSDEVDALIEETINEGNERQSNSNALRQQSTTVDDKMIREYNPPTEL